MKLRAIAVCLISASIALPANAQTSRFANIEIQKRQAEIHRESIKKDPRYIQTLGLCENNYKDYGWVLRESAVEAMLLGVGYVPAWGRFFENRQIAPDVKDLLDSEAFNQALLDCAHGDSVIPKMAAADYAGKFLGIVAAAAVWRFAGPLLVRLGTLGRVGSIAQKAVLVLSFAYAVKQGMTLIQLVSDRKTTEAGIKTMVDQKTGALEHNIGGLKDGLEAELRRNLTVLQSELSSPGTPEPQQALIRKKIERIQAVLRS